MVAMTRAEWVAHALGRTAPALPWKNPRGHFGGFGALHLPAIDASRITTPDDVTHAGDMIVQIAEEAGNEMLRILHANPKFPDAQHWRDEIGGHVGRVQGHVQNAKLNARPKTPLHPTHEAAPLSPTRQRFKGTSDQAISYLQSAQTEAQAAVYAVDQLNAAIAAWQAQQQAQAQAAAQTQQAATAKAQADALAQAQAQAAAQSAATQAQVDASRQAALLVQAQQCVSMGGSWDLVGSKCIASSPAANAASAGGAASAAPSVTPPPEASFPGGAAPAPGSSGEPIPGVSSGGEPSPFVIAAIAIGAILLLKG